MTRESRESKSGLELGAAGLDEFLRLLELRVKEPVCDRDGLPRRIVCVAAMCDREPMAIGAMRVKRYVRAGFASGDDLVTFELLSSDGIEYPELQEARKLEEKHRVLSEHLRGVLQDALADLGAASEFQVVNGCLRIAPVQR